MEARNINSIISSARAEPLPARRGISERLIDTGSYGTVFLIPFLAYAINILHSFYLKGSSLYDAGDYAFMLHDGGFTMQNPPPIGGSHLAIHISPLLFLTTALGRLLPLSRSEFYAVFVGIAHALPGLAVLWLLIAGYRMSSGYRRLAAALLALAFAFDGLALAIAKSPNLPMFFAGSAAMFLAAFALRRFAVAVVFFIMSLIVREDAGFHLFAFLSLCLFLQWWQGGDRQELRRLAGFAVAALLYSTGIMVMQVALLRQHSLLVVEYLGQPPFAHVTARSLVTEFHGWMAYRGYVVFPAILAFAWAWLRRNPQACLGYAACVPWALLHLASPQKLLATLPSYYAFPFVLAALWPLVGCLVQRGDNAAGLRREAVYGFALLTAVSFVPSPLPHNPTGMHLPANFFSPPAFARQAAMDQALAALARDKELGTQVVDQSVAALVPEFYQKKNLLADPEQVTPDTIIYFAEGFQSAQAKAAAAAGGLNRSYVFPGTAIRVATARPISSIDGLVELSTPETPALK